MKTYAVDWECNGTIGESLYEAATVMVEDGVLWLFRPGEEGDDPVATFPRGGWLRCEERNLCTAVVVTKYDVEPGDLVYAADPAEPSGPSESDPRP